MVVSNSLIDRDQRVARLADGYRHGFRDSPWYKLLLAGETGQHHPDSREHVRRTRECFRTHSQSEMWAVTS
jgi:hypothetical protein